MAAIVWLFQCDEFVANSKPNASKLHAKIGWEPQSVQKNIGFLVSRLIKFVVMSPFGTRNVWLKVETWGVR